MAIGQRVLELRKKQNLSQQEFAKRIQMDRTTLSKIETGERPCPAEYDLVLSREHWTLALEIGSTRTDGFVGNLLADKPNLDLHPAAVKDMSTKEMRELLAALEGLFMAKHIDPELGRQSAEIIWFETRDVQNVLAVMQGVIEEWYGLDRQRMILKYDMQVRNGER